jgi:hypothetical protein
MLSRAKWRLRKQLADERRAFVQTAARRLATFVILERLRRLVADSIIPGSCLCAPIGC